MTKRAPYAKLKGVFSCGLFTLKEVRFVFKSHLDFDQTIDQSKKGAEKKACASKVQVGF